MIDISRKKIKIIDNLSIKLLPGILGHKPEHGKKRPAKVVEICKVIVRILFGVDACKLVGTGTRYGKQENRERITSPHPIALVHLRAMGSHPKVLGEVSICRVAIPVCQPSQPIPYCGYPLTLSK